jgi:hypothetical protein
MIDIEEIEMMVIFTSSGGGLVMMSNRVMERWSLQCMCGGSGK